MWPAWIDCLCQKLGSLRFFYICMYITAFALISSNLNRGSFWFGRGSINVEEKILFRVESHVFAGAESESKWRLYEFPWLKPICFLEDLKQFLEFYGKINNFDVKPLNTGPLYADGEDRNHLSLLPVFIWRHKNSNYKTIDPPDVLLQWFIAELQRAKRASEAPWVRKIGNPSSWENLVMTSACDRVTERATERANVRTDSGGGGGAFRDIPHGHPYGKLFPWRFFV